MAHVGYQYAIEKLGLTVLPLGTVAATRSVTRIETLGALMAVPQALTPPDDVIEHLLFALKHEGTNLQVLAAACPHLDAIALVAHLRKTPAGQYIRKLCHVWEQITSRELPDLPEIRGATIPLFDPDLYVTSNDAIRDRKWRITFNGLGDWQFCPSVRRTAELQALLVTKPLDQVRNYLAQVSPEQLERVLAWAYLHETRSSYEIEGEKPGANKTEAFATLLRKAQAKHELDEEYLVTLQNAAVTNPLAREATFRTQQNYLHDGSPGASGVTYVPPPSTAIPALIAGISRLANLQVAKDIDPIVRAALVSFGFVFVHPFMDGNGRLSRYLAHYALCQSGALADGAILPLSTAMKRNERAYLRALQSFSAPARTLWKVQWLDAHEYDFEFRGHEAIYRFWDATDCVAFLTEMTLEALRKDLRNEVEFLACYDQVVREVDERFDIAGSTLSKLVIMTWQNGGTLSKHRRKQFAALVEEPAMDFIEERVRACSGAIGRADSPKT